MTASDASNCAEKMMLQYREMRKMAALACCLARRLSHLTPTLGMHSCMVEPDAWAKTSLVKIPPSDHSSSGIAGVLDSSAPALGDYQEESAFFSWWNGLSHLQPRPNGALGKPILPVEKRHGQVVSDSSTRRLVESVGV
ncbi:hypothetical protein P280DRAFT_482125 [Massarina eburnea CBS 473.64]|uniref:Uncharacterized protein n=1 Tax=Massarina eburnea CBS 473.64 TaxID=1395130 RepID=A0A6A6RV14_9PLEO|nr:hypothetical protein P280DRAFT_482125 [Massarina eburnea CBS 473.64]